MSVPPEIVEAARLWLRRANEDFVMAERSHRMEGFVPRGVCMWSYQSGEKAVKALLVAYDIDPPKQHDLARLALRLPTSAANALLAIDVDELSRWAIEGRNPADLDEVQEADATRAIQLAGDVLSVVRSLLNKLTDGRTV